MRDTIPVQRSAAMLLSGWLCRDAREMVLWCPSDTVAGAPQTYKGGLLWAD